LQIKPIQLDKQTVSYKDLGIIDYKAAWDYQEELLQANVQAKSHALSVDGKASTLHHLLLCEHPPVYTLGKGGSTGNILISEPEMLKKGIQFFRTNRGGDITFHGPGQVVGYPVLDLERFYTDIGRYLRELEEVIIRSLAGFGITGKRSKGETGVWIDPDVPGRERKICAMGVRCSRWVTMHGFALNVNTDLQYFDHIIPCGIVNKQVTSMSRELGRDIEMEAVKKSIRENFEKVFSSKLQELV
jgi:lipoyl(octanoyl) transferase